jgi:hypothetical protein
MTNTKRVAMAMAASQPDSAVEARAVVEELHRLCEWLYPDRSAQKQLPIKAYSPDIYRG